MKQIAAMNDPNTRKVLKRVIAQHNTGIRKPFGLYGNIYKLVLFCDSTGLRFDNADGYNWHTEMLHEVSPNAILDAINTWEIRQLIES